MPSFFSLHKKALVAGGVVLILVIALALILRGGQFSEGAVDFKIEGPTESSSGDLVSYKVTYKNKSSTRLSDVKLNFFYPTDSIVFRDNNIINTTNEAFDVGELGGGASGEKELPAYIVGDKGNIKIARANLTFKAGKINAVFKKESSLATTITNLAVPITLVASPTVVNGQSLSYLVDYRNQSSDDFKDLRFKVRYPQGFRVQRYVPAPTGRETSQDFWDVPILKKDGGSRITIQGSLTGVEKENKTISVVLQKKISTAGGDKYIDFEKVEASSVIATPLLSLQLVLNDSSDYVAHLGDPLRYRVTFKNNSTSDISGLSLSVHLDGNMFDFSTVNSAGFFDGRANTIFWNGSISPELNNLRPNQNGSVNFEVRLKNAFSGALGSRESFVKASAHLETPNVPANLELDKLTGDNELVTRISSSPTFSQKILLNNPAFGYSGPFPPKVNQKTTFAVDWLLVNPSNNISPAKVTAVLAPGVVWEGNARTSGSQAQPVYDSRLKTVTWDLGMLPSGVGVSSAKYEAIFQISITPSVNQVNQPVTLLKNVRFDGVDVFTQEKISRTILDASTNNINDTSQAGLVQP